MWIKNGTRLINTDKVSGIYVNTENDIRGEIPVEALLDFDSESNNITIIIATFKKKSDADILVEEIFKALAQGKETFDVSENHSAT